MKKKTGPKPKPAHMKRVNRNLTMSPESWALIEARRGQLSRGRYVESVICGKGRQIAANAENATVEARREVLQNPSDG